MIDAKSTVSYYRQLADHVRGRIVAGIFPPGTLLPAEREMMRSHDLSRVTVRLAMDMLAREGLIVRRRGKGTYVAPRRVRSDLSIFSGFYDALVAAGLEIDVEVLAFGPRAEAGRDLTLPYATTLFVERLYSTGGEPIAVSRSALHPRTATLQREHVAGRTNYQVLTELSNFEIGRSELAIRARLPDEDITGLLHLRPHDPIMELHRATFSISDEPLGRSVFWVVAGRFEFSLSARADRDVVHALRSVQ